MEDLDTGDDAIRVAAFVKDALQLARWDARRTRIVSALEGFTSPSGAIVEMARVGVRGSGNRGSKGTGRAGGPTDRIDVAVDALDDLPNAPECFAVYLRCSTRTRALADWIGAATDGPRASYEVRCDNRKVTDVAFEAYVGLHWGPDADRLRWQRKIAAGDSRPALEAAHRRGVEILIRAAREWLRVPGDHENLAAPH
jgi:hypothetical protein